MKSFCCFLLSIIFAALIISCAPVRTVVPLEKDESHVSAALGGPLIEFSGIVIPMPLTSLNYSRGVTEKTTLNSAVHTTSLLFGVIHMEASLTGNIFSDSDLHFGISTTPGFYFMTDVRQWQTRFYPIQDINVYKFFRSEKNLVYLSYTHLFDLYSYSGNVEKSIDRVYVPNISVGHTWIRKKTNYTLELKYLSFLKSNENIVVDYISPFSKGTAGLQFGVTRKF